MAVNINRVTITGNLTRDPELRSTPSGTSVANLRIACNTRRKSDGEWVDKPNYFDVTVWGRSAENVCQYLSKGSGLAVDGRLEWREWETKEGHKRQQVDIVADQVQFLGGGKRSDDDGFQRRDDGEFRRRDDYQREPEPTYASAPPQEPLGAEQQGAGAYAPPPADDDIPF